MKKMIQKFYSLDSKSMDGGDRKKLKRQSTVSDLSGEMCFLLGLSDVNWS